MRLPCGFAPGLAVTCDRCACSPMDRAMASGAMCAGSIPARRIDFPAIASREIIPKPAKYFSQKSTSAQARDKRKRRVDLSVPPEAKAASILLF